MPLNQKSDGLVGVRLEKSRQEVITAAENDECYEITDSFPSDCEALKCLHTIIGGLLQYEPEKRSIPAEALAKIIWIDSRRLWPDDE